jgi:tRNA threonylcarbamoyladenosine modification (KEOPS) complex Cgi121 subunit
VNFDISPGGEHVWISAVNARPQNIEQLFRTAAERYPSVSIQLVDLNMVPGQRYLTLAVVNAVHSFHSAHPIGKSLGMELLLYVAGERQISEAIKRVGITPKTKRVAVLAVGRSDDMRQMPSFIKGLLGEANNDQLLDEWNKTRIENVRSGFKIGEKELRAVIRKRESVTTAIERLAVERSALIAAKK